VGEDPLYRERIWQTLYKDQRMFSNTMTDTNLAIVEQALWDLAGRYFNQPVYKLLGGYRDKVPAYASTQPGDEMEGA
jgi:L-alanine-DL-glutamate epimerase-like enolase superfamily enzyme